MLQKLVQTGSF